VHYALLAKALLHRAPLNALCVGECSLSAVDALRFNPWHERFSLPQLTELVMNNEVTMPISAKDTFSIGGAMQGRVMRTARNQRHTVGTSGMAMTYARQFSPHSDASASVNVDVEGTRLSLAVARQLTEHSRGEMAAVLQADTLPSVVVSTTRKISECWHGRIDTEMSPAGSGVSVSAKFLSPRSFIKADVKLGLHPQNGIRPSVAVSAPLSRRSRVKLELGLLHVGVGAIHVIGEDMRGGWTVLVTPFGLVWKLSFNRHQQKFAFPILLTPRVTTLRTAAALVAPPVILLTLKHLVYKPCAKRWRDGLRRKHAPATAAARVKAAADVRMMAAAVTRRRAKQLSSGGLVIVCARYGAVDAAGYAAVAAHPPLVVPPPLSPRSPLEGGVAEDRAAQHHWGQQQNRVGGSEQEGREGQQSDAGVAAAVAAEGHSGGGDALGWLDVTDAMQFLVTDDSTLDLAAGLSYTGLTGFADPCPGEHKRLVVKYLFRGQPYILQVADGEALSLPCARTTV
jgi:hypothetical protein